MVIRKEIFVIQKRLDVCIDVTYGTDMLPIELEISDYTLPEGATAIAYARSGSGKPKKMSCDIIDNTISFTPKAKFFKPGDNELQIRVTHDNKNLFTYMCKARCQNSFADEDVQEEESQPTLVTQLLMELKTVRETVVEGIKLDGNQMITHFGTCSTAASTTAKTVTIENFELITGARVIVKFTNTNTASSATLNVNSTGAKSMRYRNAAIPSSVLVTGGVYEFVYTGTYWELVGEVMKGAASTISTNNLTTNRALISNSSGKVAVSAVTSTELGYLNGATSNIQTQLNNMKNEIGDVGISAIGDGTVKGAIAALNEKLIVHEFTTTTDANGDISYDYDFDSRVLINAICLNPELQDVQISTYKNRYNLTVLTKNLGDTMRNTEVTIRVLYYEK